jgi:hypothetical protein
MMKGHYKGSLYGDYYMVKSKRNFWQWLKYIIKKAL